MKSAYTILGPVLAAACFAVPQVSAADPVLLMAEEDGCFWCARWHAEIGSIYPKTAEGKLAPLQRYDLHSETPDADLSRSVHFTPTFILVQGGVEVARIEGYPGEDFFWGLLGEMLKQADISIEDLG